ncbi:MAG: hypothetical protein SGBAC_008032 [Bacillariaceae sp.]
MRNFFDNRKVNSIDDQRLFSSKKDESKKNATTQKKLQQIHLEMSHIDNAVVGLLVTHTTTFEGHLPFQAIIERFTEAITSNPSFVRFRSEYNKETERWTPIKEWDAKQHSICHHDDESENMLKDAESKSRERVKHMDNGKAWIFHFKYNPATNDTTMRWILNHALGDGYAIRAVLISLLDRSSTQKHPSPKISFGLKFVRPYYDIRTVQQIRAYKKSVEAETIPQTRSSTQTDSIIPVEFPGLSIRKIKTFAKDNRVTMQDALIYLVACTKKRIGGSEDDGWLSVAFNQRGLKQLDRMDNLINPLPVQLGGGELSSIHRSTKTLKGSTITTYKGYKARNKLQGKQGSVIGAPQEDRIICLTNMCGVLGEDESVFEHKIRNMRFYAHVPNVFSFISNGPSLYPTFTIEESKRDGRGELVRTTFMSIVEELNLLSDTHL